MDTIFLTGLTAECIIGIWDWERKVKQKVVIDLEMSTDIRKAAASDHIDDTLDYKKVSKRLLQFVSESEFQLVETLIDRIAQIILTEFDVPAGQGSPEQAGRAARLPRRRHRHRASTRRLPGAVSTTAVYVAAGSNVAPLENLRRALDVLDQALRAADRVPRVRQCRRRFRGRRLRQPRGRLPDRPDRCTR